MGGQYSTDASRAESIVKEFSTVEMQSLLQSTHYSSEELMLLRVQFLSDVPEGAVTPALFQYAAIACGITQPIVISMLFRAFDSNHDGLISFFEYARGMSTMTRGSTVEKLAFAFDMYDADCIGELRAETVLPLLKGLHDAFGPLSRSGGQSSQHVVVDPHDILSEMFSKSSSMSRDEFRQFAMSNPWVLRGLALR